MEVKERREPQGVVAGKQWAMPLPRRILRLREKAVSLFVIVGEALGRMLHVAGNANLIKGFRPSHGA